MISLFKVMMSGHAKNLVSEVLDSGMVGEGPKTFEFKTRLSKWFDHEQLTLVNSCTSALTMALRLCDIKPEDEVISTPYTMIATNCAVANFGAKIVWADVGENTPNASIDDILNKITPKTKAIVITDVAGIPVDLKKLDVNIPVIVDAAHGIYSKYNNRHISRFGTYVCFSLQAIKQLTTADGGILAVNNDKYLRAEKLKWFGMSRIVPEGMTRLQWQMTQDVEEFGYKFHMNDISAAIGLANMEMIDKIIKENNENAQIYLNLLPKDILFDIPEFSEPSWWVFPIRVKNREMIMNKLLESGIESSPMWRRNDEYSVFKDFKIKLPNLDKLINEILFVPVGWWVDHDTINKIIYIIEENL